MLHIQQIQIGVTLRISVKMREKKPALAHFNFVFYCFSFFIVLFFIVFRFCFLLFLFFIVFICCRPFLS